MIPASEKSDLKWLDYEFPLIHLSQYYKDKNIFYTSKNIVVITF